MHQAVKKRFIYDAVRNSNLYDGNEKNLELIADDILKKSSFVFEIAQSENEIFNYLISLVDASITKINEEKKSGNKTPMNEEIKNINSVIDPKTLSFDISDEGEYIKKLLIKLYELEKEKPDKNFAAIFYERYVQKLSSDVICKMHDITAEEFNFRLLEIVKAVNKDNDTSY